jgi:3-oxoacyl-[acyl-carrier protein] reductase
MMKNLENKNTIITGGAQGIGLAFAEMFAEYGSNISICDINKDALKSAKKTLEKYGVKVFVKKADISNSEDCNAFVKETIENLGKIDVLINNAGVTRDNLTVRMSEADWDLVININLKGAFLISKVVLTHMMKNRSGSVVNVASIAGQAGNAGQANYSASKSGLIGLTKSLAREFAGRNIRVNAIAPGFVRTAMTEKLPQDVQDKILATIPLKRFAEPQDIAKAALFLAGEQSTYITGQVLGINGGLYI